MQEKIQWSCVLACYSQELDSKLSARLLPRRQVPSQGPPDASCTSDFVNAAFSLICCNVMAAHPAAKAINTQELTSKAQRDLLQLLETVSKDTSSHSPEYVLTTTRFEGRRTWSSSARLPVLLAYL